MKTFCKDYLTEDTTPDFSVHWTEEDIQSEQDLSSDLAARKFDTQNPRKPYLAYFFAQI